MGPCFWSITYLEVNTVVTCLPFVTGTEGAQKEKNIIILRPDKGKSVVVLDKLAYNNAISDLLSDNTNLEKLQFDLRPLTTIFR